MKKLLIGLTSLVLATGAFAQGKVSFSNAPTAPVTVNGFTADSSFSVELLSGASVLATTKVLAAGFFQAPGEVTIDGIASGSPADLTVRVFKTDLGSWDAAVAASTVDGSNVAFKSDFSINLGGGGTPPTPAPGLGAAIAAAGGFSEVVVIPEPGVLALGLVGAGAFFMRRRRA